MSKQRRKKTEKVNPTLRIHRISGKVKKGIEHFLGLVRGNDKKAETPEDLAPKYDPKQMYGIYENSDLLLPNVEAYAANVDGFGFRLSSRLGLHTEDAVERVRNALFEAQVLTGGSDYENPASIPDAVIESKLEDLRAEEIVQRVKADNFFENAVERGGFEQLRIQSRIDLEVTGSAFWEMIRGDAEGGELGVLEGFERYPSAHIKLRKLSKDRYPVRVYKRFGAMRFKETIVNRRVRSYYVEASDGSREYFKEYGCKAVLGSGSGEWFPNWDAYQMWVQENPSQAKKNPPAKELLQFKLHGNDQNAYGVPRWVGSTPDVLGSRSASVYNLNRFENGMMSSKAVLVSGGALTTETTGTLEEIISEGYGLDAAHQYLVIEASKEPGSEIVPKIEIVPLQDNADEGSFQEYMRLNEDKVGSQFRIPRIVRGVTTGTYNRATAEAALQQADAQVFAPIRKAFDRDMSSIILPELGVSLLLFVSNGYSVKDTQAMGDLTAKWVKEGILTPGEAREIGEDIFDTEFVNVDETWANTPTTMYQFVALSSLGGGEGEVGIGLSVSPEIQDQVSQMLEESRRSVTTMMGAEALILSGDSYDTSDSGK